VKMRCCSRDVTRWNEDVFGSDPVGSGHPLCCEGLDVFDGMVRGEDKELAD